ncbi:hypothetical protein D9M73_62550 [compost metagenome]
MSGRNKAASVPRLQSGNPAVDFFGEAAKDNLDWLTGQHVNAPKLKLLPATATLADVIEQVNAQYARLQRGG